MKLGIYQGQVILERYRKGQYRSIIFGVSKMVETWENVYSKWTIEHICSRENFHITDSTGHSAHKSSELPTSPLLIFGKIIAWKTCTVSY